MGKEGGNKKRSSVEVVRDELQDEKRLRRDSMNASAPVCEDKNNQAQELPTVSTSFHFPDLQLDGKWYLNVRLPRRPPRKSRVLKSRKLEQKKTRKQLPKRFEVSTSDYYLPFIRQELQRICHPPSRLHTKSSYYALYRQACNETCRCHEASGSRFPTLEQAPEQARAFFSQLPPEVANQLVVMITQFSNRAPPGSRVVLVVRPLPLDPLNAGRRKYQLQLRYVREGEMIEPSTRMDSTKSESETTSEDINTSLPEEDLQSTLSPSDIDAVLSEKYFLFSLHEIEVLFARRYRASLQTIKQHLSKHSHSWPQGLIKQTVSEVFSFLESTPAPKWPTLQLAIHRIELLRYLRQLSTALSTGPSLPVREEDINQRWALFLLVDQKVKTFVSTFGDEKSGCTDAVALTRELSCRWEQTSASLTPLQTYLRISEPASPSIDSPSMTSTSTIPSSCILPSPQPPC
eukprot:TRINITY_DN2826_c0_g1_i3.p1 TRINITY_DN2826_c0_g1~~TRINITY_DN2826_c0_g1_i3.p1  ORF type:complete len:460 (-),score=66.17 TRINITY_DN2826_c0_g1_i3:67-1446(-)